MKTTNFSIIVRAGPGWLLCTFVLRPPPYIFLAYFFSGVIDKSSSNKQVLDHLPVERDRGITVKAQTATMFYHWRGEQYMLNLIDTPVRNTFTVCACMGVNATMLYIIGEENSCMLNLIDMHTPVRKYIQIHTLSDA